MKRVTLLETAPIPGGGELGLYQHGEDFVIKVMGGQDLMSTRTHGSSLDRGAPVSPYTVGQELGHGGTSMVERVYAHLGQVRHRSEVVEFRIEHHREAVKGRLEQLERAAG